MNCYEDSAGWHHSDECKDNSTVEWICQMPEGTYWTKREKVRQAAKSADYMVPIDIWMRQQIRHLEWVADHHPDDLRNAVRLTAHKLLMRENNESIMALPTAEQGRLNKAQACALLAHCEGHALNVTGMIEFRAALDALRRVP